VFGGFTYDLADRGLGLMAVVVGATSAALGTGSWTLLRKRRFGAPALAVFSVELLCETRRTQKSSHLYVGPFRVSLRAGWFEFWPEGQVARVELCLPPISLGSTWAGAVVVSLPGIDIKSWHGRQPPNPQNWLRIVGLVCGIVTLGVGVIVTAGIMWQRSVRGILDSGSEPMLEDVEALNAAETPWSSRVTIQQGHRAHMVHGDDSLCNLGQPSELVLSDAAVASVDSPFVTEIDAVVAELCDSEERAARLDETIRNLGYVKSQTSDEEAVRKSDGGVGDRPEVNESLQ
jgi:hypothetical protein